MNVPNIGEIWTSKHPTGFGSADYQVVEHDKEGILIYDYDKENDVIKHLMLEKIQDMRQILRCSGGETSLEWVVDKDKPSSFKYKLQKIQIVSLRMFGTGQGSCTLQQLNDNWKLNKSAVYVSA